MAKDCKKLYCDNCEQEENMCDCDLNESPEEEYQKSWCDFEKNFPSLINSHDNSDQVDDQDNTEDNPTSDTEREEKENNEEMETQADHEKNGATNQQSTHGWSVTRRKFTKKRQPKISDNVLKENKLKNKIRESIRDSMKKKKEEKVNVKRDIPINNSDNGSP